MEFIFGVLVGGAIVWFGKPYLTNLWTKFKG